ncbi:unnamed protein product [Citrullus colocynthis]|uniref:Uncharacterized protein n=1 Tax=Citrullus colocynthis TaxID=252529 RepID=A0ABP0Z9R0_9ROSI
MTEICGLWKIVIWLSDSLYMWLTLHSDLFFCLLVFILFICNTQEASMLFCFHPWQGGVFKLELFLPKECHMAAPK